MSIDWSKPIRTIGTKEPLKYRCWRYINNCPIRYVDCPVSCDTYFYFGNGQPYTAVSPMLENYEPEPENKPMTVDWTKPIQTKRGIPARLLTDKLHCPNGRTYVVAYGGAKHGEGVLTCNANGSPNYPDTDEFDIINVPEKRTGYINIYENGSTDNVVSLEVADKASDYGAYPIARIKVEYTVGQFDI